MKFTRTFLVVTLFLPCLRAAQSPPRFAALDPGLLWSFSEPAGVPSPAPAPSAVGGQVAAPLPPPPPEGARRMNLHRPRMPLGKWWKDSEIARELQLTDAQVKQVEQTFLEHKLKLTDLRADLEKQEAKLQPLLDADQPDEAQVSAQIDAVTVARGNLEKENAMMMLAIRRALSVEQWKKLETMQRQRERIFFHKKIEGAPRGGQSRAKIFQKTRRAPARGEVDFVAQTCFSAARLQWTNLQAADPERESDALHTAEILL